MKIVKPVLLATALAAAIGSAYSIAAPDGAERHGKRFPVDLSVAEARMNERFASIDTDDNEQISATEFENAEFEGKRKGRHGKKHRRHEGDRSTLTEAERAERKAQGAERRAAFDADLFAAMDSNGDGQLSAEEASRDNKRASKRKLKRQHRFAKMDSDGNGQLSRTEFGVRLAHMQAADTNGDGTLSRDEAKALREQHRAARQRS
ncbi:MAG: hypothetical protein AB8B93_03660 [Pseudomonadales bacterium]